MSASAAGGRELELDVGGVAHGGACTARAPDGRVVFVRHALPGERVRAVVTEERAHWLRADAVEVLRGSADRVVPPCPYAGPGRCGGCDWQHASLPAQRALKATVVREQFGRLAGLDLGVAVEEVAGAPEGLGWRTRVRFAIHPDGRVGFHRHRSHLVEPVDACRIAHPLVEGLGIETRRWPHKHAVEAAVAPATSELAVLVDGRARRRPVLHHEAAGRTWRVTGGGFWQAHPGAADCLAAAALELLEPQAGESVVDLYAGAGLFAGVLGARTDAPVLAVEGEPTAAADAAHNLRDLPAAEVWTRQVSGALLDGLALRPDLVVLDPPRTGAGREVSTALARLGPRAICYVACDPAVLARDVGTLGTLGYRLAVLRAYDVFPMTAHVECVALLVPDGQPGREIGDEPREEPDGEALNR